MLPSERSDPAAARDLRARVAEELPRIDEAARRWTGLGADLPATEARVIGRRGWVEANLGVMASVVDGYAASLPRRPAGASQAVGAQLGTLLGLLSTRVLGQYVLPLSGPGAGQLVVVGPNVLSMARHAPGVVDDLRRTVMLHEVAHRLQFDGVPWLGDHLRGIVSAYLAKAARDPAAMVRMVANLPRAIGEALRGGGMQSVLEGFMTPEQLELVEQAQAMMSLLEGHGNATMHLAADGVVDDPGAVEEALDRRRADLSGRLLRSVVGMERKQRQYTEGEAFVRAVVDRAGVEGLNRAWQSPASLPGPGEIEDPDGWMERVGV